MYDSAHPLRAALALVLALTLAAASIPTPLDAAATGAPAAELDAPAGPVDALASAESAVGGIPFSCLLCAGGLIAFGGGSVIGVLFIAAAFPHYAAFCGLACFFLH